MCCVRMQTYLDVLALEPVGGERDEGVLVQRQPRTQHQNGRARNLEGEGRDPGTSLGCHA